MINAKKMVRQLAPLAMLLAVGCAPAYYDYGDYYINCNYCPAPPLPYTHFEGCVCHACVASPYLSSSEEPTPAEHDAALDALEYDEPADE